MAAAAAAARSGGRASNPTATTNSRFAAACGALSQYIKAAEAERTTRAPPPVRPLPLMPGADVDDGQEELEAAAAGPPAHQLTIVYGGRALVLDDVPADKAVDLLRLAAVVARGGAAEQAIASAADLPVARKASLQRFMAKRRGRVAARAEPYRRPGDRRDDLTLAL